ncbi:sensor histidine kinase [Paenibacillus sinopodophylli]|uniref:sensor histidine kinase n=1 Tax=Paenibacillus sinopodophylli TaxID=1837342 RepID=UPI00110D1548|nr:histidine kinase [Paenibacillus sinopodophylli]
MKFYQTTGFFNSIFFKLFAIFILLLPVTGLFIYANYQSRSTLITQVHITHENMLQSYLIQIDNQLKNAVTYGINTAWFESDPQLALRNNESESALAKMRISLKLSDQILSSSIIDTLFVYTDNEFISSSQNSLEIEERTALKSYVIQAAASINTSNISPKANWNLVSLYNHSVMVNLNQGDNGVLTGAYINLDRLLSHYEKNDENSTLLLLPNTELKSLEATYSKDNLIITGTSSSAPISFAEIIPESNFMNTLPFMQKYTLALSVLVTLLLPFVFLLLRLYVVQPLQKLNRAMKHIQRGELHYRITPYRTSNEIAIVNHTFNQMMDEVQHLKISVYEEEIKTQKSQLRNLQMQIQPHFIVNSLNMVYNLIENKDHQTAKQLIIYSVDFYRYMVSVDADLVPLHEEVKHVSTYLQIQTIRYKDRFTYSINIDPMVEDMLVPPMLIQNFVENSIKYAIHMNKCIHISIKVNSFEINYYPYALINISDTGNGYPVSQLECLNHGKKIIDDNGQHIGLRNTVQRLALLFEGQAKWHFYNDHGAVSELILPARFSELTERPSLDEE